MVELREDNASCGWRHEGENVVCNYLKMICRIEWPVDSGKLHILRV